MNQVATAPSFSCLWILQRSRSRIIRGRTLDKRRVGKKVAAGPVKTRAPGAERESHRGAGSLISPDNVKQ